MLNKRVPWNLNNNPFQFKSTQDSGQIAIFLSSGITKTGFNINPAGYYMMYYCIHTAPFPVDIPTDSEKIWTVVFKSETITATLQLFCNGVEVLNFVFSDAACTNIVADWRWDEHWLGLNVAEVEIRSGSVSYRSPGN